MRRSDIHHLLGEGCAFSAFELFLRGAPRKPSYALRSLPRLKTQIPDYEQSLALTSVCIAWTFPSKDVRLSPATALMAEWPCRLTVVINNPTVHTDGWSNPPVTSEPKTRRTRSSCSKNSETHHASETNTLGHPASSGQHWLFCLGHQATSRVANSN